MLGALPAPAARWVGSTLDPTYLSARSDGERPDDPPKRRLLARIQAQQDLIAVLGAPVLMNTNILVHNGRILPRCRYQGTPLTFSVWAPHRRLLLDIFPDTLPSEGELQAREAFATQHGLRYAVTPPGYALSIDDLRAALAAPPVTGGG